MAINLPKTGTAFFPQVPEGIQDPMVANYLQDLRRSMVDMVRGMFSNSFTIATAINSGTSGTFTLSSGGSIIVTSGIVITVTS